VIRSSLIRSSLVRSRPDAETVFAQDLSGDRVKAYEVVSGSELPLHFDLNAGRAAAGKCAPYSFAGGVHNFDRERPVVPRRIESVRSNSRAGPMTGISPRDAVS